MSQGKFSAPRPHRDEERQIEETFRQLTGQAPAKKPEPEIIPADLADELATVQEHPAEFDSAFEEDFAAEFEAIRQPVQTPARGAYERPAPEPPRPQPRPQPQSRPQPRPQPYRPEPVPYDEPMETADEDLLDKVLTFVNQNKKLMLAFLCAAALLIIVSVAAIFFFGSSGGKSDDSGTIYDNVYIADIHVGGLTKKDAIALVKEATSGTYSRQDMVIDLSGTKLQLSPSNTGAQLDVQAAVDAAYTYGRTGTDEEQERAQLMLRTQPYIIALLPYLDLDQDYILETLTAYAEDTGSTLTQTSYGLEGNQPPLEADRFNKNNPTQTLVITMGTPGIGFDAQDVYEKVLDAYSLHEFLVTVENVETAKEPDPLDLEAVYEEFYIEPKNATVDLQTFKTIPGSYGYGFDLEKAQELLDEAEFGEELRIPMEYIEPDILDEDMFFRDELGQSRISYDSDRNRNTNLQLACEAINGLVLNPGEQFSFNGTVGQRSSGNGYKSATETLTGNEEAEFLGGGIGQVASALYEAALLSDLEINYRVNHDLLPDYAEAGLDVAVDWRSPDFQFTNTTGFPIRIEASASNGNVSIQILGTDEREYYIELETVVSATEKPATRYDEFDFDNEEGYEDGEVLQKGIPGQTVKTYRYKYDKATGELITKDFVATSKYDAVDEIIARVKPEETTEPETEPPTEPETKPTEPPTKPTEPPTVPTQPPTQPETQPTEPQTQPTAPPTTPAETEPDVDTITVTEPEVAPGTDEPSA